jgi:hypothetical protein
MNRVLALSVAFILLIILHGFFLVEAFGGQPGTLIQLAASKPLYFVAPTRGAAINSV